MQARPWGPSCQDGFDSGAGAYRGVLNDLRPCIRAGRRPHKRESQTTQTKTETEVWKPPKVGTGIKYLQNRDSVRLPQDTANFQFWTTGRNLGLNGPKMGEQTSFWGKGRTKHNKKAAHTFPGWILSMNRDTKRRWRQTQSCPALFF